MSMSKTRIERLEKANKQTEVGVIFVYKSTTEDYMSIEQWGFEGTIEEGRKLMNEKPSMLYLIGDENYS